MYSTLKIGHIDYMQFSKGMIVRYYKEYYELITKITLKTVTTTRDDGFMWSWRRVDIENGVLEPITNIFCL